MAVAPRTLEAAARWLHLLRNGPLEQARSFVEGDPSYLDLSRGQYSSGLALLTELGVFSLSSGLNVDFIHHSEQQANVLLAASVLAGASPSWLEDPYIDEALDDPPMEALRLIEAVGLEESQTRQVIRRAYGKADLESRAVFGAAGERALIALLERAGVDHVEQVSAFDDGAGFDVQVVVGSQEFHLEVKTTTKRRSLRIFLSRNEFDTSQDDVRWRMVVVGLDECGEVAALGTLDRELLAAHVPVDRPPVGSWASSKMVFRPADIHRGLELDALYLTGREQETWWRQI